MFDVEGFILGLVGFIIFILLIILIANYTQKHYPQQYKDLLEILLIFDLFEIMKY